MSSSGISSGISSVRSSVVGLLVSFTLMGCGGGKGAISDVKFENAVVNNEVYLGMDATLASGGLVLPNVTLPLYNPKNPSQILGEIQTNGRHIIAKVNATQALKFPDLADGTKLPNGAAIPLVLPQGLNAVAIPAFNSSSLVYVAVNGGQIMLGVAVSILKEDRLNLPLSIFLPFTISPEIRGTGGFFLGEKQGVAVFALRESIAAPTLSAPVLATTSRTSLVSTSTRGRIEVRQEALTNSKIRRLQKTWASLDEVRID